jgi:hypothetical protein
LTDDLKKLSVQRLRELARAHLGKGYSRLRTKAELLAALKDLLRSPVSKLREAAESVLPSEKRVRVVDFPSGSKDLPPEPGKLREGTGKPSSSNTPSTRSVKGSNEAHSPAEKGKTAEIKGKTSSLIPRRAAPPEEKATVARTKGQTSSLIPRRRVPQTAVAQPVPSMPVTRTKSTSGAAHTSSLTPRAGTPRPGTKSTPRATQTSSLTPRSGPAEIVESSLEEGFFEIPAAPRRARGSPSQPESVEASSLIPARDAGTEAPVLLVRDPTTLFVFWDFRRELERGAALGLREPRTLLRIYQGETLARSLELPLRARSTYVAGLRGGEEYTAEVAFLGRDGWTRPVGRRSAPRRLPPGRPSEQLEVRTLRLPWPESLERPPQPSPPQSPTIEPLDSPRRIDLPTSPAGGGGPTGGGPSSPRSGRN